MVIPLASPATTYGILCHATRRDGAVFVHNVVIRCLVWITKLRISCLVLRKNRLRRGCDEASTDPANAALTAFFYTPTQDNDKPSKEPE